MRRRLDSAALREQAAAFEMKAKQVAAKEREKQQADDLRRSILAGEAALHRMMSAPESAFGSELLGLINDRAISKSDRALFNLPPKDAVSPTSDSSASETN